MAQYGPTINSTLAGHFSDSIFHSEQEFMLWLKTEKERYGVTGFHISDDPHIVHALWENAQKYDMDPMIGVVKLQQENGLLSHAINQDNLDWAFGYGATDSGLMYEYQGFDNQVSNMYERLAELRDEYNNCINPATCHQITVDGNIYTAETVADYMYYTYTPHSEAASLINQTLEDRDKTFDLIGEKLESLGIGGSNFDYINDYVNSDPHTQPDDIFYTLEDKEKFNDYVNKIAKQSIVQNSQAPTVTTLQKDQQTGKPKYSIGPVTSAADFTTDDILYERTRLSKVSNNNAYATDIDFSNFKPFPKIYGVPPMTGSKESDSMLLDSMQYIFIRPGIPMLEMSINVLKFIPAFDKFKEVVQKIAADANINLRLESVNGEYLVFAISNPNTYSYSVSNSYGAGFIEGYVRKAEQNNLIGQIVQSMGGVSMLDKQATRIGSGFIDAAANFGKYSLGNTEKDLAMKKAIDESAAKYKSMLKQKVSEIRDLNKSSVYSSVKSIIGALTTGYTGRRTDIADVWQDSNASLSYNFTIDLRSISTIDSNIYVQRVLEPLLVLLALATPRNFDSDMSASFLFDAPFLVNVKIPGVATIEHGAITDVNVTIDSSEMSLRQTPRNIKVTFTVVDLYQVLTMFGKNQFAEIPMVSKYVQTTNQTKGIRDETIRVTQRLNNGLTRASMSDLNYY